MNFSHILNFSPPSKLFEEPISTVALTWQYFQEWAEDPDPFPALIPKGTVSVGSPLYLWKNRGPVVKPNGLLTQENEGVGQICHNLSPKLLSYYDNLGIGAMVITANKSSSCDMVVKVNERLVIEIQMKYGTTTYNRNAVEIEIGKSIVKLCPNSGYRSIFVFVSTGGVNFDISENPFKISNLNVFIPNHEELGFFMADFWAQLKRRTE